MTETEINHSYDYLCLLLSEKRIKEALDEARKMAGGLHSWQAQERIAILTDTYKMMLQYAIDGVPDPEQRKIYLSIIADCYRLAEDLREELLEQVSAGFAYSQKRYLRRVSPHLPPDLLQELELASANRSLPALLEESLNSTGKRREYARQHETLGAQLFWYAWLSDFKADGVLPLVRRIMESELVAAPDKCLAVSGLTLALMRHFDENCLNLLIELCTHSDEAVAQRALAGLLPALSKYDVRLPFFPNIRNRLVLLFDDETVKKHALRIILQYVRTSETEHLTRKMQEEILPEMKNLMPKIREKIREKAEKADEAEENRPELIIGAEDADEKNPEWQEMLENTGIAEKLMEFSELQMEGSDVYMSTFYMLKNFPFFNEIANWFRPFDPQYSEIYTLFDGKGNSFLTAMTGNTLMCNSDCYSFCFSMLQVADSQRGMMGKAFEEEAGQMAEMQKEENILQLDRSAEKISNAYIQDLYRFYNLFGSRRDFVSPFEFSLSWHKMWFFGLLNFDADDLRQIAEFYFAKDLYPQAIEMFDLIGESTADIYQKKGYCCQKTGNLRQALHFYLQAEIIQPDNKWTIRKIAYCYRAMGDFRQAVEYYLKAEKLLPDNTGIPIQIGNCYLELKEYDHALQYYFKVEYLTEENIKMWRAIAWASFMAGKMEQADRFYEKILARKPEWTDCLNAAHAAWAGGNEKRAILLYQQAIEANGKSASEFIKAFNADIPVLQGKKIDSERIMLMLDYLRYFAEK